MCGIWADFDFAVRFMVVSYMVTLCVLRLIVRYMAAIVRYMVDCAVYGYCAFYGLYIFYVVTTANRDEPIFQFLYCSKLF